MLDYVPAACSIDQIAYHHKKAGYFERKNQEQHLIKKAFCQLMMSRTLLLRMRLNQDHEWKYFWVRNGNGMHLRFLNIYFVLGTIKFTLAKIYDKVQSS